MRPSAQLAPRERRAAAEHGELVGTGGQPAQKKSFLGSFTPFCIPTLQIQLVCLPFKRMDECQRSSPYVHVRPAVPTSKQGTRAHRKSPKKCLDGCFQSCKPREMLLYQLSPTKRWGFDATDPKFAMPRARQAPCPNPAVPQRVQVGALCPPGIDTGDLS